MKSADDNPTRFLEVAVAAAKKGGEIVAEAAKRPKHISYKSEVDIVTEADKKSEAAIVAHLRKHFPEHAIVAEEGSGSDKAAAKYTWYVDPLDGTTNFAHGFPVYAVSLGLLHDGEPLAGVVLNPATGEIFTAIRNQGAFRNGVPIHVSNVDRLSDSLLATGFPTRKRVQNPNIFYYWEFTLRSHGVRRAGAAALDLCSVACGQFDGFWEFGLKPWDTAAGILLVSEAGGKVSNLAGQSYHPGDGDLLVSNGLVHEEMLRLAATVAERAPAALKATNAYLAPTK